jgi:hypothetical protein
MKMSVTQIERMIRQDIERMPSASPSSVLMVSADASVDERQKAVSRLLRRYRSFSNNRNISESSRQSVDRLKSLVIEAHRALKDGMPDASKSKRSLLSSKESLLQEGMRLVNMQSWAQAYAVLARAQRLDMTDPLSMAYFGWAQYHHKGLDLGERVQEGSSHINLAYQFDQSHPDICYFFVFLIVESRRPESMQLCIDMRRKFPDDARFVKLQEKLQATLR